jgi:hypothetical protein
MCSVRVHGFALSLDGYGAGPNQDLANPLGVGGTALHEWTFATRIFQRMYGQDGRDVRIGSVRLAWQATTEVADGH